ncbi:MAG: leucine-rich repeat domain-containing protein [Treponema sp.]|nr:leucine-rich repeat domain-containing protein [Treponema sp.]
MKKLAAVFVLFISMLFSLFSEDSVVKQFETFEWEPVANSSKYQINIQILKAGEWEKYFSDQTKKTSMEVPLEPGTYRVSIATFNILGKKNNSEWTEFYIFDESIPYFYKNYLDENPKWKAPVLYVNGRNLVEKDIKDSKHYINFHKGKIDNTFVVKGRNIFSTDTVFSLVPVEKAKNGVEFNSFYHNRPTVPLKIESRDSKKYLVTLSFDPELLYSGYYSLEVTNGSVTDSLELLVISDYKLDIKPHNFTVDSRYHVNTIELPEDENLRSYGFAISGTGFTSDTVFYMKPTFGAIDYPFETEGQREIVPLTYKNDLELLNNQEFKLSLGLYKLNLLKNGYYNVVAENKTTKETSLFLVLVKLPLKSETSAEISKIKTKYNKQTKDVDIIVTGKNLSENMTYTLVSEYESQIGSNTRIDLPLEKEEGSSKLKASLSPIVVPPGNYMLLTGDGATELSSFIEIDNHYKSKNIKVSEEKFEQKFLRPDDGSEEVILSVEDKGTISITANKYKTLEYFPKVMPFLRVVGSGNLERFENVSLMDFDTTVELDVLNINWFSLGLGLDANFYMQSYAPEINIRFIAPWNYFKPFVGVSGGYNVIESKYLFKHQNGDDFSTFRTGMKNDLYTKIQFGATLFDFYDFRYNLEFHELLNSNIQKKTSFGMGIRIPVRLKIYEPVIIEQKAEIVKRGQIDGHLYERFDDSVTELHIEKGATKVSGFENYRFQKVKLPASVTEIGKNAFADCENLTEVELGKEVQTICQGAFANDNKIQIMEIPASVKTIEKGAFENWTSGQVVHVQWNPSDNDTRNLEGLRCENLTIKYKNGHYEYMTKQVFENVSKWVPSKTQIVGPEIIQDQNKYLLGVKLTSRFTDEDFNTLITGRSSSEVLESFKSSSRISFDVQGDGSEYELVVVTKGGSVFAKSFSTNKRKKVTVQINYKDLKKKKGTEKTFDVNDVTFVQILPVPQNSVSKANKIDNIALFSNFKVD